VQDWSRLHSKKEHQSTANVRTSILAVLFLQHVIQAESILIRRIEKQEYCKIAKKIV